MNNFSKACPNGNTLLDAWREIRIEACPVCNGEGCSDWDDPSAFAEALSSILWRRKMEHKPVETFKEMMRVARVLRKRGQTCYNCDGTGEVTNG